MNKPLLQLALDTYDLPSALSPLQRAATYIDVIEVGTILCLAEGMQAVRAIKSLFPHKIVLADVRIAEAGSVISRMAFDAGADWVTVVSGAAPSSFQVVLTEARSRQKDMQIELSDGWTWEMAQRWADIGVQQLIFKRSRDAEAQGNLSWQASDFDIICRLHEMGFQVTVTGGLKIKDIPLFANVPVYTFIVGRAICQATDPLSTAAAFQQTINQTYIQRSL